MAYQELRKKEGLKIIAQWMEGFVWDDAKVLETDSEDYTTF